MNRIAVYADDLLVAAFAIFILILAVQLAYALPKEWEICVADAHKLCPDALPNPFKVLACFQEKRHLLSKPCADLLLRYGQ